MTIADLSDHATRLLIGLAALVVAALLVRAFVKRMRRAEQDLRRAVREEVDQPRRDTRHHDRYPEEDR